MDHNGLNTHKKHQFKPYNKKFHLQGSNNNSSDQCNSAQQRYRNLERSFDNRGNEINNSNKSCGTSQQNIEETEIIPLSPLEEKAKKFLQTVLNQEGIRGKLIFLEIEKNVIQTMQTTAENSQLKYEIIQNNEGLFILKIGDEEVAKGVFTNKQTAKSNLTLEAMDILKNDCFYIIKKKEYEEVATTDVKKEEIEETRPHYDVESKAHKMMLKMGWSGKKGLGINEQGDNRTVAEIINSVSRQSLEGTKDIFKHIHQILEDYSKSDKMTLLKFDPHFSSEERAHIHKIAIKLGLKSKSEGKGEQRRITVTKKLHRADLVYNLLISDNFENDLYKLIIPFKFAYLWYDDDEK